MLALLLAINGLNVVNSYVGRYFMTAIERRDTQEFVRQALLYVGVFAASTLAAVLQRFTEERLDLLWREWLTLRLVGAYLQGRLYYRMEVDGTLPNPDQRIAVRDWHDVLSIEEQQLLGIARLLLAAPRFAVLPPLAHSLGTGQAAHVLTTLAGRGIGSVVLRNGGVDRGCFDAVVEIAADGT